MNCIKCGKELPETAKFCRWCGISQSKEHLSQSNSKENHAGTDSDRHDSSPSVNTRKKQTVQSPAHLEAGMRQPQLVENNFKKEFSVSQAATPTQTASTNQSDLREKTITPTKDTEDQENPDVEKSKRVEPSKLERSTLQVTNNSTTSRVPSLIRLMLILIIVIAGVGAYLIWQNKQEADDKIAELKRLANEQATARNKIEQELRKREEEAANKASAQAEVQHLNTPSPSFDCGAAQTLVEQLICADKHVAELDLKLSKLYLQTKSSAKDEGRVIREQVRWLKSERDICADSACLVTAYQRRISELSVAAQQAQ